MTFCYDISDGILNDTFYDISSEGVVTNILRTAYEVKNMTKTQILVTANLPSPQQGMMVTLESTGLFLGVLVSFSMLLTGIIQIIGKFNSITSSIRDLREDINKLSLIDTTIKEIVKDLSVMDKRFEIHLKDCENRKETVQMLLGQLNEKIDHKAKRFEGEIKAIEEYLQDYKIRASASE